MILPNLGRKLFAIAVQSKIFLLVEGGSNHNNNLVGQPQYLQALTKLMDIK